MPGKYDSERDEAIHALTMDGTCEVTGEVDAPCGHVSLVEDYEDSDFVVVEDSLGFVHVFEFEHIAIDAGGYFQPARRAFEAAMAEYEEWLGDDEE